MQVRSRAHCQIANMALTLGLTATAMAGCAPEQNQQPQAAGTNAAPAATKPSTPTPVVTTTLLSRIVVNPPAFHHPPVSNASIQAVKNAILALPAPLRKKLDENGARVIIAPNMIDRWPESIKDLPEQDPQPTLAEQPGRIYGLDMCVYERPKNAAPVT